MHSDTFDKDVNYALIVLTVSTCVWPECESFGKVRSGNLYSKLRENRERLTSGVGMC